MAREDLHFRLRIPEDLKVRIESAANMNERSMTAEIIARLQWTFGPSDEEFEKLLDKIADRDGRIRELERERDELAYKFELLQREHQARREHLRDEMIKAEELRAALAKESGRSSAFQSVIEILARHIKEWSDGAEFSVDQILDAVEKTHER